MKSLADIAAELQGYDPKALSADMVGEFLSRLVVPVTETEEAGIFEALGRVLAADVVSPFSVPPHDNSAMDGFAFDGAQLREGAPLRLKVAGTALAGEPWRGRAGPGECVKITTGAVMPQGLDTVVPQELISVRAEVSKPDQEPAALSLSKGGTEPVEVLAGPSTSSGRTDVIDIAPDVLKQGDNRRLAGEDLMQGGIALHRGERLGPAALGLAASIGLAALPVFRRLRVAYFSTGDEILSLGEPPREGAVYDSNRYTVFGMLMRLGCEVVDLGVVADDPAALEAAFLRAAREADAVITSGGVSVGEADHTKAMMRKLGDVAFWRIAMRPGRPMAVGLLPVQSEVSKPDQGPIALSLSKGQAEVSKPPRQAILFGLPGNPVAVMVTFLAFVRPALLRMMGARPDPQPLLKARSTGAIRKKPGRTEYQRGIVRSAADGSLEVVITGNQGSGVLSSMVQANGLIVLHHAQGSVAAGEMVDVMMFEGVI